MNENHRSVNEAQPNSTRKKLSAFAPALGMASIFVAALALALDKSLPYRIGPDHYVLFLWVGWLMIGSLVVSVAALVLGILSNRPLPIFFGLLSIASIIVFSGGSRSGPNPQAWCYNNLRAIEAAKDQLAEEMNLTNGAVLTAEQISKYINGGFGSLKCAEGGHYVIGAVGAEPGCSFHGSMGEIEAGWKRETLKNLEQTRLTNSATGTNSSK